MRHLRIIMLLIVCLGMVNASFAYAAMPCCSQPAKQTSSDSGDIPCHKTTKQEKSSKALLCDGCQCTQCIKITALVEPAYLPQPSPGIVADMKLAVLYSHFTEATFHPPRA